MTHRHALHDTTQAKILVSALERQVSWVDIYGEVVDQDNNLAYTSKYGKWHYYTPNTIDGVVDSGLLCLEGFTILRKLTIAHGNVHPITIIGV